MLSSVSIYSKHQEKNYDQYNNCMCFTDVYLRYVYGAAHLYVAQLPQYDTVVNFLRLEFDKVVAGMKRKVLQAIQEQTGVPPALICQVNNNQPTSRRRYHPAGEFGIRICVNYIKYMNNLPLPLQGLKER